MLFVVIGALAALQAGCADAFGTRDPRDVATDLGTFHVTAALQSNTCGDGALGAAATWAFDVKLSRDVRALYWNNGAEVIAGPIDDNLTSFSFDTGVIIDMRTPESKTLPACSVRRDDHAAGTLDDPGAEAQSFTGTLTYDFAPTEGSQCGDLVAGSAPVFAALPCSIAYRISGARLAQSP